MSDKKKRDEKAEIKAQIMETPTASDAQVAAAVGVNRTLVSDVRAEMGAKHTWKKEKQS